MNKSHLKNNAPIGTNHHMPIKWEQTYKEQRDFKGVNADLSVKAALITRIGAMFMQGGAGGWRVRDAINRTSKVLNVTSAVSVGLTDLEVTVRSESEQHSQTVVIPESGVDTNLIINLDKFLKEIDNNGSEMTIRQYHKKLDSIKQVKPLYSFIISALAAGFACGAFTFLLGGGLIEILCAFIGAGAGQLSRKVIISHKINQYLATGASVGISCLAYIFVLFLISLFDNDAFFHQMGYIGAMLFVIPGFPLITSVLDMFLFDMRSGVERLVYATFTIIIATLVGWLLATFFQLKPGEFIDLGLDQRLLCLLRFIGAFVGVAGFSIMFNSPLKVACIAGIIGGFADTLNLELVNFFGVAPEIGAFVGALCAGIMAHFAWKYLHYPRTVITVPSIVIMIPGLYLYKAMFYMASFETASASTWLLRALMVIVFLPFGLALARAITDSRWRHTS